MFNIYCKAIVNSISPNIEKYAIYKGTFDEAKQTFCVVTRYDSFICKAETFKHLFRVISATKL